MDDYDDYDDIALLEEDDWDDFEDDGLDDDEMEELLGEYAEDEDDDSDEAFDGEALDAERRRRRRRWRRRRRRSRPIRTASRRRSYRPRLAKSAVTQPQLQAAASRLDRKITSNGRAIKKVNARVNTVNRRVSGLASRQDSHAAALRKEEKSRKSADEKLRSNMQMLALLPMLTSKSITTTAEDKVGGVVLPAGTKLSTASDDSFSAFLPLLAMGGMGGEGGDSNMLLLALAMGGK